MKLKCKGAWLKELAKSTTNQRAKQFDRYYGENNIELVDTGMLTTDDLVKLKAIAAKDPTHRVSGSCQKRITAYLGIMQSGKSNTNVQVKNLVELEPALRNYLANLPNAWLFSEDVDGILLPFVAAEVKYEPRNKREGQPARVTLRMAFVLRGERQTKSITWHKEDVRGKPTVEQVLLKGNLFPEKPALLAEYSAHLKLYHQWFEKTGMQFLASGTGHVGGWSRSSRSLVEDDEQSKMVMDDLICGESKEEEKRKVQNFLTEQTVQADVFGKDEDADEDSEDADADDDADQDTETEVEMVVDYRYTPTHCYVNMFRLSDHSFYTVHVANLTPYPWDTKVQDKLVLSEEKKDLINILITSAGEVLEDIVKGKTGGVIVLASGPPGTGKTLTAEVYCETTQSPLYSVQCSQLGTDEEAVEEQLRKVLKRAMRWKAILLIDEADVYVRSRESDIQQNAIVGVFLRTLERYRGIMFLTTNRATTVDDAILSRLTAHLRYEMPNSQELTRIWEVLSKNYKVQLSDAVIKELVKQLPHVSGRSVKNMLKLGGVILKKEKRQPDAAFFVRMSRFLDIEPKQSSDKEVAEMIVERR